MIFIKILLWIYKYAPNRIRKLIDFAIIHKDKGEYFSKTLREIYKNLHGLEIGMGSYGCFNHKAFPNGTKIGNYCSIARDVVYLNGNHPMEFISMHPMFYNTSLGYVKEEKIKRTFLTVGHDVWIGQGVKIVSGCNYIGNGAVIAAGSVVTKNVEPYTIIAGVPAKPIKKRFSDDLIKAIEETKWYEMSPNELAFFINEISNPNLFIEKFKKQGKNYGKKCN